LESKVLLTAQKFPFITNLSRKGGTPVAVAVINALLKMAEEGK
jgi:precorrin-8X/cobalt-precorrin-8 methylmutase